MKKQIVLIVLLMALVNFANAFRISPVRLDLTINRGTTKEVLLTLTGSQATKPETLAVFLTDISMSRNGTLTFKLLEGFKHSAVPWIKLEQADYTLIEKQTKELKLKISVPMNANPGEYYSAVMVEPTRFTEIKDDNKPFVMLTKSRIAVVIVIDVPGRIYEKKGDALSANIKEEKDKLKIFSTFNNTGNIHLDVFGMASVRSKDGKTRFGQTKLIATGTSKDEAFVFPGNMRDFEGTMDKQLPSGEYVVDVMFDYGAKIKKAIASSDFSISRETNVDESKNEFLILGQKNVEFTVPMGAMRTKVIKVSNTDYRPINVSFTSSEPWLSVSPGGLYLEPGKDKNIMLIIYNDGTLQKEAKIIARPDRGMPSELKIQIKEK